MSAKTTKSYIDDDGEVMEIDAQWFREATRYAPAPAKKSVNLRLDVADIEWFKAQGKGYQTRIQQVLKAYIAAHRAA